MKNFDLNSSFSSSSSSLSSSYKSTASSHIPLRIADVLRTEETYGDENGVAFGDGCGAEHGSVGCSTPHWIVSRCLFGLAGPRTKNKKKKKKWEKSSDRAVVKEAAAAVVADADSGDRGVDGGSSPVRSGIHSGDSENSASSSGHSGRCEDETSFNVGVGYYLLHLIAASKNELSKVAEMRTQMETFLRNSREELQRRDALSKPPEPNDIFACDNTADVSQVLDSESQPSPSPPVISTSRAFPETSAITVCDRSLKCHTPKPEERWEGMDQLEAELEAELERMQLQLEAEKLAACSHQQSVRVTTQDNASLKSHIVSSGEVIDPVTDAEPEETELAYGVTPHELERRLHELLEARQQEQIRELEAALECVNHKLREKELEVSWWKDTATLLSRHVPETPDFSSQTGPNIRPSLR